ncbi:sugar transferase [Sphingomonas radiodurans]|uniref:sugar transferase n=1 Tax=Sphingomonas radiodurans TaxID=2890321 RepID=UPI002FD3750C
MHMAVVTPPAAMSGGRRFTGARWDARITRMMDLAVALIALAFFLPLMLVIATIIYVTDPGPVFFAHRRVGRGGRHFRCLKFRSMAVNAEELLAELLAKDAEARAEWARDHKLKNDPRITAIGGLLRKSSLDELPQLFNVLRGEMSLVGPRPIVDAEVLRYGRYFAHYCSVRPGITGLWQVSGRNNTSYRRRVAFDVTYSRSRSALFDAKILVMTVPSVMLARGSY